MKKVFFGPDSGVVKTALNDIVIDSNIEYLEGNVIFNSRLKDKLCSKKLIKQLPLYAQNLIYKFIFKYQFLQWSRDESILFIFFDGFALFNDYSRLFTFIDFLKKYFRNSKFALYKYDIFNDFTKNHASELLERFDISLTFDRFDSERYPMEYYGGICETGTVAFNRESETCDIFFSGGVNNPASGRWINIINLYKNLVDSGFKCIFYLFGMNEEQRKILYEFSEEDIESGIKYRNSYFYWCYCPYQRNLAYYNNCKAVLEYVWPIGLASCTMRVPQALGNHKKLITNCPSILEEPYYHPENILVFTCPEDITTTFLDIPMVDDTHDFTPTHMIDYIEKRLSK